MPTPTKQTAFRLPHETVRQIAELADRWRGLTPPSPAAVVTECVRRVHQMETQTKGKRR